MGKYNMDANAGGASMVGASAAKPSYNATTHGDGNNKKPTVTATPPGYGAAVSADFSNHCHMGFMYVDRRSHTLFSVLLLSASFLSWSLSCS